MNSQKEELRKKLRTMRQAQLEGVVAEKSREISHKFIDLVEWPIVGSMHIYSPVPGWNEINTEQIKRYVYCNFPKIELVSPLPNKDEPFPDDKFDLIVVPVLGFDKEKFRLGNGGGWYDRWLANQVQAIKIGLAYSFAQIDNLPHEAHDIPLDNIVTEVGII